MRLRLFSLSLLLAATTSGLIWLSLQPVLARLVDVAVHASQPADATWAGKISALLPFFLGLDLLGVTVLTYLTLELVVGRPLRKTESAIEALSRLELDMPSVPSGGPLLSRLQRALKRMADALAAAQAVSRKQVAELIAANEQLTRAQTELVAAERLAGVGRLAAGVAHEVGNPLSGILAYLSVMGAKSGADPVLKDLVARTEAEVQRIDQIVRSLLDLGRPVRGRPLPVEVDRIIRGVVSLVKGGPEFARVEIHVANQPGLLASAEPGPLSQVLLNLLINAAQALEGKGEIWVTTRPEGGELVLVVEDSGAGIASEALPRLFEPFFTTKEPGKGTGLGLAVSRHLLSSMGGSLKAENREQGGARFTVRLPQVVEPLPPRAGKEP